MRGPLAMASLALISVRRADAGETEVLTGPRLGRVRANVGREGKLRWEAWFAAPMRVPSKRSVLLVEERGACEDVREVDLELPGRDSMIRSA